MLVIFTFKEERPFLKSGKVDLLELPGVFYLHVVQEQVELSFIFLTCSVWDGEF